MVAPLRNTTRLSGEPVSAIVARSPATIAITITNTATTSAIPPAVIAVETRRTNRLRTLYLSGIAIQATVRSASTILRRAAVRAGK